MEADTSDVSLIRDEDLLRRMWQQTEDFGRKKEIRAHMYKLREARLKEFYTSGEVLRDVQRSNSSPGLRDQHQKGPQWTEGPTHADSLADHSFLSLKSKEIRDSESPTREVQYQNAKNRATDGQWTIVTSTEKSDDGKKVSSSVVAKTQGTRPVDGGQLSYAATNEQRSSVYSDGDASNYTKCVGDSSKTFAHEDVSVGDENNYRTSKKTVSSSSSRVVSHHHSTSGEPQAIPDNALMPRETENVHTTVTRKQHSDIPDEKFLDGNTKVITETKTLPDGSTVTTTRYETKGSKKWSSSSSNTQVTSSRQVAEEKSSKSTSERRQYEYDDSADKRVVTKVFKDSRDISDNRKGNIVDDNNRTITVTKTVKDSRDFTDTHRENVSDNVDNKIVVTKIIKSTQDVYDNRRGHIADNVDNRTMTVTKTVKDTSDISDDRRANVTDNRNKTVIVTKTVTERDDTVKTSDLKSDVNIRDDVRVDKTQRFSDTSDVTDQCNVKIIHKINDHERIVRKDDKVVHNQDHDTVKVTRTITDDTTERPQPAETKRVVQEVHTSVVRTVKGDTPKSEPELTRDESKPKETKPVRPQDFKPAQPIRHEDEIGKPKPRDDQYQTTYRTEFTNKRISVDVSPTHDAFARSLRAVSPDRMSDRPKSGSPSRCSNRSLRTSNSSLRSSTSPEKLKSPEDRKKPLCVSPDRKPSRDRFSPEDIVRKRPDNTHRTENYSPERKISSPTSPERKPSRQNESPERKYSTHKTITTDIITQKKVDRKSPERINSDTITRKKKPEDQISRERTPSPTKMRESPIKDRESPLKEREPYWKGRESPSKDRKSPTKQRESPEKICRPKELRSPTRHVSPTKDRVSPTKIRESPLKSPMEDITTYTAEYSNIPRQKSPDKINTDTLTKKKKPSTENTSPTRKPVDTSPERAVSPTKTSNRPSSINSDTLTRKKKPIDDSLSEKIVSPTKPTEPINTKTITKKKKPTDDEPSVPFNSNSLTRQKKPAEKVPSTIEHVFKTNDQEPQKPTYTCPVKKTTTVTTVTKTTYQGSPDEKRVTRPSRDSSPTSSASDIEFIRHSELVTDLDADDTIHIAVSKNSDTSNIETEITTEKSVKPVQQKEPRPEILDVTKTRKIKKVTERSPTSPLDEITNREPSKPQSPVKDARQKSPVKSIPSKQSDRESPVKDAINEPKEIPRRALISPEKESLLPSERPPQYFRPEDDILAPEEKETNPTKPDDESPKYDEKPKKESKDKPPFKRSETYEERCRKILGITDKKSLVENVEKNLPKLLNVPDNLDKSNLPSENEAEPKTGIPKNEIPKQKDKTSKTTKYVQNQEETIVKEVVPDLYAGMKPVDEPLFTVKHVTPLCPGDATVDFILNEKQEVSTHMTQDKCVKKSPARPKSKSPEKLPSEKPKSKKKVAKTFIETERFATDITRQKRNSSSESDEEITPSNKSPKRDHPKSVSRENLSTTDSEYSDVDAPNKETPKKPKDPVTPDKKLIKEHSDTSIDIVETISTTKQHKPTTERITKSPEKKISPKEITAVDTTEDKKPIRDSKSPEKKYPEKKKPENITKDLPKKVPAKQQPSNVHIETESPDKKITIRKPDDVKAVKPEKTIEKKKSNDNIHRTKVTEDREFITEYIDEYCENGVEKIGNEPSRLYPEKETSVKKITDTKKVDTTEKTVYRKPDTKPHRITPGNKETPQEDKPKTKPSPKGIPTKIVDDRHLISEYTDEYCTIERKPVPEKPQVVTEFIDREKYDTEIIFTIQPQSKIEKPVDTKDKKTPKDLSQIEINLEDEYSKKEKIRTHRIDVNESINDVVRKEINQQRKPQRALPADTMECSFDGTTSEEEVIRTETVKKINKITEKIDTPKPGRIDKPKMKLPQSIKPLKPESPQKKAPEKPKSKITTIHIEPQRPIKRPVSDTTPKQKVQPKSHEHTPIKYPQREPVRRRTPSPEMKNKTIRTEAEHRIETVTRRTVGKDSPVKQPMEARKTPCELPSRKPLYTSPISSPQKKPIVKVSPKTFTKPKEFTPVKPAEPIKKHIVTKTISLTKVEGTRQPSPAKTIQKPVTSTVKTSKLSQPAVIVKSKIKTKKVIKQKEFDDSDSDIELIDDVSDVEVKRHVVTTKVKVNRIDRVTESHERSPVRKLKPDQVPEIKVTSSPKKESPSKKCITIKSIVLNKNEDEFGEVIIDLQRSTSSRETSPDKVCPCPVSEDEDTGRPRYPDKISEPEDTMPRRTPQRITDVPLTEEEHVNNFSRIVDITDEERFVNSKVENTDESLLSVSEKVSRFINTAEKLTTKEPKAPAPKVPRPELVVSDDLVDDECLLSVSDKVSKFITTAEQMTTKKIDDAKKTSRDFIDNEQISNVSEKVTRFTTVDSTKTIKTPKDTYDIETYTPNTTEDVSDECLLSVSDKVTKFLTTAEKVTSDIKITKPEKDSPKPHPITEPETKLSRPSPTRQTTSRKSPDVETRKSPVKKVPVSEKIDSDVEPGLYDRKSPERRVIDDRKRHPDSERKSPERRVQEIQQKIIELERRSPERKSPERKMPETERISPDRKISETKRRGSDSCRMSPERKIPETLKTPVKDARTVGKPVHDDKTTPKIPHSEARPINLKSSEAVRKAKAMFENINKPQTSPPKQIDILSRPSVWEGRRLKETKKSPVEEDIDQSDVKLTDIGVYQSKKVTTEVQKKLTYSSEEEINSVNEDDLTLKSTRLILNDKKLIEKSNEPDEKKPKEIRSKESSPMRDIPGYMRPTKTCLLEEERRLKDRSKISPEKDIKLSRSPTDETVEIRTVRTYSKTFSSDDEMPGYMRPLQRNVQSPDRAVPRRDSPEKVGPEDGPRAGKKFGVTLRRTDSGRTISTTTTTTVTERRRSSASGQPVIEDIHDLKVLEQMMDKVVGYEQRRRIRSQIRVVKRLISENKIDVVDSKRKPKASSPVREPKASSPVREPKSFSPVREPKASSPVREPKASSPVREPKATSPVRKSKYVSPDRKSVEHRKTPSPTRKPSTEYQTITRRTVIETIPAQKDEIVTMKQKRSEYQNTYVKDERVSPKVREPSPEKKKVTETITKTELKRVQPVSKTVVEEKPSWVTQRNLRKTTETTTVKEERKSSPMLRKKESPRRSPSPQKDTKPIDCITSSYGIGPTDENGLPLFGIKALRKAATDKVHVRGTVVTSQFYSENGEEPVGEVSVTKYSNDPKELGIEDENVTKTKGLVSVTTTQKIGSRGTTPRKAITDRKHSSEFSDGDDNSKTKTTTVTRRGSVKALSQKFIENAVETSKSERQSYPKAGLILRTSSFKDSTHATDSNSSRESSPGYEDEEVVRSTTTSSETRSTARKDESKTFLSSHTRVSNAQDVITRMKNSEKEEVEGDTVEDKEARTLLNKFLGAQVLMSGMEPLVKTSGGSSSASLVRRVQQSTTTTTSSTKDSGKPQTVTRRFQHPITQEVLEDIWDEQTLRLLLEQCSNYEERRIIRARLKQVMAEQEACANVVASAVEERGGVGDRTESIQERIETTKKSFNEGAITTTQVTRMSSSTKQVSKPMSPFAKFRQLDKQNSLQTPPSSPRTPVGGSGAPLFKFTDPALSHSASTIKDRLLHWCQMKTKEYQNIKLENFSTSWADGLAFCALIHHFLPDTFDYNVLTPKQRRHNFTLAFKVADEQAGIAPLLDVDDMVAMKRPDWKCVFTYVQSIYRRFKDED